MDSLFHTNIHTCSAFLYSCSVTCCKEHKSSESCKPFSAVEETTIEINTTPTASYMFPTDDTIPLEKLNDLGT